MLAVTRQALATQGDDLDALAASDERPTLPNERFGLFTGERCRVICPAAPYLCDPQCIRLGGRGIHDVEFAAWDVLHCCCGLQENCGQGISLSWVSDDLAIESKSAHRFPYKSGDRAPLLRSARALSVVAPLASADCIARCVACLASKKTRKKARARHIGRGWQRFVWGWQGFQPYRQNGATVRALEEREVLDDMATATNAEQPMLSTLGRRVLRANGVFSVLSGAALAAASKPIARFLGPDISLALLIVGGATFLYAVYLLWVLSRPAVRQRLLVTIGVADAAWVVVSLILLLMPGISFTGGGRWAVGVLGLIVAGFAAVEFYALWRAR